MTESYSTKQGAIVKDLITLAKENNVSIQSMLDAYSRVNKTVYDLEYENNNNFKIYDSRLEDRTLEVLKYALEKKTISLEDIQKN